MRGPTTTTTTTTTRSRGCRRTIRCWSARRGRSGRSCWTASASWRRRSRRRGTSSTCVVVVVGIDGSPRRRIVHHAALGSGVNGDFFFASPASRRVGGSPGVRPSRPTLAFFARRPRASSSSSVASPRRRRRRRRRARASFELVSLEKSPLRWILRPPRALAYRTNEMNTNSFPLLPPSLPPSSASSTERETPPRADRRGAVHDAAAAREAPDEPRQDARRARRVGGDARAIGGAFIFTPVPIRPRRRGGRRFLRTFNNPGVSLRPSPLAFNPDAHASTPAFQLRF